MTIEKSKILQTWRQCLTNILPTYIGPNLASNIPDSRTEFCNFWKDQNPQSLFFAPVVEEEVKDKNFRIRWDYKYSIKNIVNEIVTPLTHILNLSLSSGKVPHKMKIARVVPIFKKGQKDSVNNYRPISLLTSVSKILEKLVYTRTVKFLLNCKFLCDSQFGFRKKSQYNPRFTYFYRQNSSCYRRCLPYYWSFSWFLESFRHNWPRYFNS